jgi:hypothetical protein
VLGYNYPGSPWYERAYSLIRTDAPNEFAAATGGATKPEEAAAATPEAQKAAAAPSQGFFGRMFATVSSIF